VKARAETIGHNNRIAIAFECGEGRTRRRQALWLPVTLGGPATPVDFELMASDLRRMADWLDKARLEKKP
jgi:hypothetical protein